MFSQVTSILVVAGGAVDVPSHPIRRTERSTARDASTSARLVVSPPLTEVGATPQVDLDRVLEPNGSEAVATCATRMQRVTALCTT